ncbi:unnamed protein product [Symbiodinium pilosum]|uniref:Uncharacterized protein n=1 Tax=Symbiodinium pilosum TaxID=2952 RepID=A0A812WQ48_SYMPI|nr:unnamed protein product [Symbiodinium pilosum]
MCRFTHVRCKHASRSASACQEAALQNLTQQQPAASFNSSSGLWKEIRKRAKVTAVEPFSADGPPAVVYTGQTASAAATILMGTTTCFAAVAWTTQSTLKHVKEASWQTLSPAIAIFSAVQLLYILREMTNLLVSDNMATEEVSLKGLRHHDCTVFKMDQNGIGAVAFARLILGYAALQLTFFLSRQRKLAKLGCHHSWITSFERPQAASATRRRMSIAVQFGSQLVGLLSADAFATWQELFKGSDFK